MADIHTAWHISTTPTTLSSSPSVRTLSKRCLSVQKFCPSAPGQLHLNSRTQQRNHRDERWLTLSSARRAALMSLLLSSHSFGAMNTSSNNARSSACTNTHAQAHMHTYTRVVGCVEVSRRLRLTRLHLSIPACNASSMLWSAHRQWFDMTQQYLMHTCARSPARSAAPAPSCVRGCARAAAGHSTPHSSDAPQGQPV